MFSKLLIHNWRQFNRVEIDFHRRLTVLTGANGTGKTTLLHLLNRHWGWNIQYVSSPLSSSRNGLEKYWAGFWSEDGDNERTEQTEAPQPPQKPQKYSIGNLTYRNGQKAELSVPGKVAEVFGVEITLMGKVPGVYVPSHRPPYLFQKVDEIPVRLDPKEQIFRVYLDEVMARLTGSGSGRSPSYHVKRSLISLATFGYGNVAVERNEEAVKTFEGFESILRIMLPGSLGFKKLKVKVPDVLLSTDTVDFSFEAVSGGIAAIIDMAWQIHMYSQLHDEFVVVIDEPETHLHPALQQRLLPDLLTAFPKAQFIVSTHNPFMVTSVPDSNVYVLNYNAGRKVDSALLDKANKAGSADEILMEVLGVPSTIPQWARTKITSIVEEFSKGPLTHDSVTQLRTKMSDLGMGHLFPETLATVAEGKP